MEAGDRGQGKRRQGTRERVKETGERRQRDRGKEVEGQGTGRRKHCEVKVTLSEKIGKSLLKTEIWTHNKSLICTIE